MYLYSSKAIDFDVPEENSAGDCYVTAVDLMLSFGSNTTAKLVHGIVTGQGAIEGIQYGHAWVEKGNTVYDFSQGKSLTLPKEIYYAIGNITDTVSYSYKEMVEHLVNTNVYGPWDKMFDSYY